jgi:hypothetical protein
MTEIRYPLKTAPPHVLEAFHALDKYRGRAVLPLGLSAADRVMYTAIAALLKCNLLPYGSRITGLATPTSDYDFFTDREIGWRGSIHLSDLGVTADNRGTAPKCSNTEDCWIMHDNV